MDEIRKSKQYDLEERIFCFAKETREFIKDLPNNLSNLEDAKQLVRSSGSVGANYIEANESFSKKDFIHRVKICRKEAKESRYWLELINLNSEGNTEERRKKLIQEATELMNIFGAIVRKSG